MEADSQLREMGRLITQLKDTALEMQEKFHGLPAARRNMVRILASIKMLELNFSDLLALEDPDA